MMYGIAVMGLIGVLYDGKVMWYEATVLVSAYVFYITGECYSIIKRLNLMYNRISKLLGE